MERRNFIKLSLATGAAILMPTYSYSVPLDTQNIQFSASRYDDNKAQTIILFLYGGPSQLAGNLSNIEEIKEYSQGSYGAYFGPMNLTEKECWYEAGGDSMDELIASGDMTLYRTCYSLENERTNVKSHGITVAQMQKGVYDIDSGSGGIIANIATILEAKGKVNHNTLLPFVTMEGESDFYQDQNTPLAGYLKPVGIEFNFANPYDNPEARSRTSYYLEGESRNQNPQVLAEMRALSRTHVKSSKLRSAFANKKKIADFIKEVKIKQTPDSVEYLNNDFAHNLEAAIKILDSNADTKMITIGGKLGGGWDDHSNAKNYLQRHKNLFAALKSAMAHLEAIDKKGTINIMVFGEFGRNVNLNGASGWDHGNLQNVYVLGGTNYFTHQGVVGETTVHGQGGSRIYLKPKEGTYWFDPHSIAATLYHIYGIENSEVLTEGYAPLNII